MEKNTEQKPVKASPVASSFRTVVSATVLTALTTATAFAAEGDTDVNLVVSGGLASVAVIAGLMASGSLKALPTYVAWAIRKGLSMLR